MVRHVQWKGLLMSSIVEGASAPDFRLPSTDGTERGLSDYRGRAVVLYFYPKDDTPGCTKEACSFRDALKDFEDLGSAVLGISRDSAAKHVRFTDKYGLNFPLLADEDGVVCALFGTWVEKSMYGKKYMGVDRATFLIDGNGVVRRAWRNVKVPGHVEEVRAALAELAKKAA